MKNVSNTGLKLVLTKRLFDLLLVVPLLFSILILASCSESVEKYPEVIRLHGGASQAGPKGGLTEHPVEIQVLGPERMSSGNRRPVPKVAVRVTALQRNGGYSTGEVLEGVTDEQGILRLAIPYGEEFGDRYFMALCPNFENVHPITFHLTAGLELAGSGQETLAGNELPEPLQIRVDGVDGVKKGVPVYFKIVSGSS